MTDAIDPGVMKIDITEEEKENLIFSRKMKEYEKDEVFQELADYGLRDALTAKPGVIANNNGDAYALMVEAAKIRRAAETAKPVQRVDEPIKAVEPNAPLTPKQQPLTTGSGVESNVNILSMDIYNKEKMRDVKLDLTTSTLIEITRPRESDNKYGI